MGFLSTSTTLTSLNNSGTPQSTLNTPGTPQSTLNTPGTPKSAFNTSGTPYSAFNTPGTQHSAFNTPGTPYLAFNTSGTQHSLFNSPGNPGTPYSDTPMYTFNTPFCTSGPCSSYSTGQPHGIDPATPGEYNSPEFNDNKTKKSIHSTSRICTPGPYFTSPNLPTDKSYPQRSNQPASKCSVDSAVSTSYPEYSQGSNVSSTGSYSTSVQKSRLPEYSRESHPLYSLAGVHKYKQGK